jgi:hypothetical protein
VKASFVETLLLPDTTRRAIIAAIVVPTWRKDEGQYSEE